MLRSFFMCTLRKKEGITRQSEKLARSGGVKAEVTAIYKDAILLYD